jgi:hypothetical protein
MREFLMVWRSNGIVERSILGENWIKQFATVGYLEHCYVGESLNILKKEILIGSLVRINS